MDRRWFLIVALVAVVALVFAPAIANAAELSGTVKSVDAAKKSCVVTGADGKDTTVTLDDKTEVVNDGKKGAASDVKAGAKVKVTHTEGKASKIEISK